MKRRITFRIEENLWQKLKVKCAKNKITCTKVLTDAVLRFLGD